MRWEKQNFFYAKLISIKKVKKGNQIFYEVAWISVEENLREENSVDSI